MVFDKHIQNASFRRQVRPCRTRHFPSTIRLFGIDYFLNYRLWFYKAHVYIYVHIYIYIYIYIIIFEYHIEVWYFRSGKFIIFSDISRKFIPKGSNGKISPFAQVTPWRWIGDKPLSQPSQSTDSCMGPQYGAAMLRIASYYWYGMK